ncbi:hypothetical protein BO443_110265 [Burkholderia orbicola]
MANQKVNRLVAKVLKRLHYLPHIIVLCDRW